MENVPEVIGSSNVKNFALWLDKLESLGYKCYWQVLNAKDYGVPQNRERCFMISILGDYYYDFPHKIKLEHKLNDILQDDVDESFYLSDEKIEKISKWKAQQDPLKDIDKEKVICPTLTARGAGEEHSGMILINEDIRLHRQVCNQALDFMKPNDVIDYTYSNARLDEMKQGYIKTKNSEDNTVMNTLTTSPQNFGVCVGCAIRGREDSEGNFEQKIEMLDEEVSNALTCSFGNKINLIAKKTEEIKKYRIRKLTAKECFRLMGVKDQDFENIAQNQSNASLYHLAGDSIVVDVLKAIFGMIL